MNPIPDITLIGGGIIGMLTAREFHKAGASVAIIEKNQLGQESSWAGGGILLPIYPWRQAPAITALVLPSLKAYPELNAQLLADTGLDPEWTACGLLITQNPDQLAALAWCQAHQIASAMPEPAFFNMLDAHPEHPLWLPDIAQIRNPRLVKSLRQDLRNKGIRIYEHCELTAVSHHNRHIHAISTTHGEFAVNELVITSGAWSGGLYQRLFVGNLANPPQISPVKGQMLLFDAEPGVLPFMALEGDHYLIPRRDGRILAGSTVEHVDFDKTTTAAAKDRLQQFALGLLPSLRQYPLIKHWAGLRPGTAQGVPYIARHPEIGNLSINAGHFRNGLVMGPASARLLVDLMLQRPPQVAPEPYQFLRPE